MNAFSPDLIVLQDHLRGGESGSFILRRGYTLRLTDSEGGANVAALFYNAAEKLERYNMADTLKAQHIFYLTAGYVCYSDMGRILVSLTADTCGWHDTVCGVSNAALVREKYGEGRYQELRNDFYRNGRDRFLVELGKWGLGKRDLVANINFFSKVTADGDGQLHFHPGASHAGAFVDLRAEMDVLVVLHTCPHPLDPHPDYAPRPAALTLWESGIGGGPDDPCRLSRPENARGFANTARHFCQSHSH
ncbi:MAG TPA: urea carboxylase-associated family protein [Candidatus Competibacteraceae bacterium]|nr:MAG: urea carboxylase-associated family protein [Candidatus Competibacteraceae bacterium]HQC73121.1 urea carboxylase-associated family protein [Candidatus Competibacteraceae bacterium]